MMWNRFFLIVAAALWLMVSPVAVQAEATASTEASADASPAPTPQDKAEKKDEKGEAGWAKKAYFKSSDGKFTLELGSRVQVRYTQEDPDEGESRGSFRVRRAKFALEGKAYEYWKYKVQAVWSGGSTTLEDAYFVYTKNEMAQLWVGQGKAFFGRQELTSSGKQQFVDRSITSDRFAPSRDQGIALIGETEENTFEYNIGVYNGNGRNQSRDNDNDKMILGRLVWTPLGEYKLEESSLDYPSDGRVAIGISGLSTTDGDDDVSRVGVEFAYKIHGFNTVAEYYTEDADSAGDTDGFYVQIGYLFPNKMFEIAGRYATISPDVDISADETETGIALNYYIKKHDYKVQLDFRNIEDEIADTDDREIRLQLQIAW